MRRSTSEGSQAPRGEGLEPTGPSWARWHELEGATVDIRFDEAPDGRLEAVEVRVVARPRITGDLLRALPVHRIEALANEPEIGTRIRGSGGISAAEQVPIGGIARTALDPRTGRVLARPRPPDPPNLVIPTSTSGARPSDFYHQVAERYRFLTQYSRRPAVDLATANSVPVTTAHRWIKEARRRGLLPPGRRGRAG